MAVARLEQTERCWVEQTEFCGCMSVGSVGKEVRCRAWAIRWKARWVETPLPETGRSNCRSAFVLSIVVCFLKTDNEFFELTVRLPGRTYS